MDVGVKCMVWEFQIHIINERGRLLGVTEGSSDHIREVCVSVCMRLLGTSQMQEHKVTGHPMHDFHRYSVCLSTCAVYERGSVGVKWHRHRRI
jgi:hypothetical protein